MLYAGTINAIPRRPREKDAPGVSVESLTDRDAAMRPHFSNPEIQYIGSTSGCGCAFPHVTLSEGEWPFFEDPRAVDAERDASDRRNREALVSLLRATDEETVELYGVWDGDFMEAPKAREVVLVERLLDSDFRFKEQGFYGVTVKSTS